MGGLEVWWTRHEVLDRTELTYKELVERVAAGTVRTRMSGGAQLYLADDVWEFRSDVPNRQDRR